MIPAARRCGLLLPLVYIAARCNRSDDKSVDCDLRLISYMNKTKRASCQLYAVKNIRILTDILLRVFHILTESVPYIRLYPSIGGIAKRGPALHCRPALRYTVDSQLQTYTDYGYGSVQKWKTRHKTSVVYGYFLQRRRNTPAAASRAEPRSCCSSGGGGARRDVSAGRLNDDGAANE